MRIVIISDSHGQSGKIDKVLQEQPQAEYIFFLGDNVSDIEDYEFIYPNAKFRVVSGNCDYNSFLPSSGMETVGGVRIFYTHGHTLGVKCSVDNLIKSAKQNNCQIALYGHTHISNILYEDGLYIVNPGSLSRSREGSQSYAVIDITQNGIMPMIIKI